jgi:hypothetical protein
MGQQLLPATSHNASVPVTVVPTGQSIGVQVLFTSDLAGNNLATQSNVVTSTSTGSSQTVLVPITTPAIGGTYYVFVAVSVNGVVVGVFAQGAANSVVIPGVTVGTITWS